MHVDVKYVLNKKNVIKPKKRSRNLKKFKTLIKTMLLISRYLVYALFAGLYQTHIEVVVTGQPACLFLFVCWPADEWPDYYYRLFFPADCCLLDVVHLPSL